VQRKLFKLVAALLIVSAASVLYAQQQGQSAPKTSRIGAIAVTGTRRLSADQIASAAGLKVGDVVSTEQIQAAADHLAALGVFSSVNYRFSSKGDAISLEFQVQEAHTVPLSFDNFPWFSDAELNATLKAAVILYDGTAPGSGTILDSMSRALVTLLGARGVHAEVAHALVTLPGSDRRVQQFHVEGPALKVEGVEFTDTLAKNDHAIQARLPDLVGKPFSRSAVELFEFEQVRPIYLAHAFLRVSDGQMVDLGSLGGSGSSSSPAGTPGHPPSSTTPAYKPRSKAAVVELGDQKSAAKDAGRERRFEISEQSEVGQQNPQPRPPAPPWPSPPHDSRQRYRDKSQQVRHPWVSDYCDKRHQREKEQHAGQQKQQKGRSGAGHHDQARSEYLPAILGAHRTCRHSRRQGQRGRTRMPCCPDAELRNDFRDT